ncbi:MAG TPA: zinc-ribbon domain-containing protein [Pricia antarctica]|uniref:Zinc-ribbon domain-containing protein n=1 Tax=Pricia antarctica TaxID=641691 RepID=A0A831VT98_9FLAO|nr:zinc-ribbon domain-containing protein [Pricia antarctica]
MILFFGTRPGKAENIHLDDVPCPFCGQIDTLTLSRTSNWFHLFWIRIFRISSNVFAECSHCKRVYYEEEFTEPMQKAL